MASNAADFATIRFSTDQLPERQRLPMWREEFGRAVVRVDIEPLSNRPFHAEATLRALPGLRTIACNGSTARLQRTPAMAAEGDDSVGLVVNLGKRAIASQRGREVVLATGREQYRRQVDATTAAWNPIAAAAHQLHERAA